MCKGALRVSLETAILTNHSSLSLPQSFLSQPQSFPFSLLLSSPSGPHTSEICILCDQYCIIFACSYKTLEVCTRRSCCEDFFDSSCRFDRHNVYVWLPMKWAHWFFIDDVTAEGSSKMNSEVNRVYFPSSHSIKRNNSNRMALHNTDGYWP